MSTALRIFSALIVATAIVPSATLRASEPDPLSGQGSTATAKQSNQQGSLVTEAQKVAIRFSDIPKLNGEYRVNADDTINIPGLGRVTVAGMSFAQLDKALAEKVASISGREVFVTSEVVEYRPIFITGQVARPGPWPWQPGLTVGQAIAAAGGVNQSDEASIRRRKARAEQASVLAALARARAEQRALDQIPVPNELLVILGQTEAKKIVGAQTDLMMNRRNALKNQLGAIELGKKLSNQELESLQVQRSKLDDQLRLRRKQSEKIQLLLEQKLTVVDRALEESIKVSDLEEKHANLTVGIARVQATIAAFDRDALNAADTRKADIDAEVIRLERELAQVAAELNLRADQMEQSASVAPGNGDNRYVITRRVEGATKAFPVNESSALLVGDILTATQERP